MSLFDDDAVPRLVLAPQAAPSAADDAAATIDMNRAMPANARSRRLTGARYCRQLWPPGRRCDARDTRMHGRRAPRRPLQRDA